MKSYFLKELKYQLRQIILRWAKPVTQCIIALLISIGSIAFWTTSVGQRLDLWVLEKFFEYRGPRQAPEDVVIVAIDDETYQQLDVSTRLPFPRILVARALEQIVKAEPKVVILDARIPKEREDLEADQKIEDALRAGPITIWSGKTPQGQLGVLESDPAAFVIQGSEERFRKAAKMELPMLLRSSNGVVSDLTFDRKEQASLYDRVPLSRPLVELAKFTIDAPGAADLINYYGPRGTIKRIPLYKLLGEESESYKQLLKGKVILFGFQSIGRGRGQMDKDEFLVSVSSNPMFGVEIHANIVANLIDHSWLRRFTIPTEMSMLYVCALLIAVIGIALTPEKGIPLFISLILVVFLAAYRAFSVNYYWFAGLGALLATAGLTMLGNALYHYIIIKSFKKYIQKTFKFDIERSI